MKSSAPGVAFFYAEIQWKIVSIFILAFPENILGSTLIGVCQSMSSFLIWLLLMSSRCSTLAESESFIPLFFFFCWSIGDLQYWVSFRRTAKSFSYALGCSVRTIACQTPLSMKFSRQEHGAGCHLLLRRIFLIQGSVSYKYIHIFFFRFFSIIGYTIYLI